MAGMTDEEAEALDEYYTNNEIAIIPDLEWRNKWRMRSLMGFSRKTADYLVDRAEAENKSPLQIVKDLIAKERRINDATRQGSDVLVKMPVL